MIVTFAAVNELALAVFGVVLLSTLAITFWASKRTSTATEFWAAGRGISGVQNGFAIAGDFLSASTFLGFSGLIFLFGLDGWIGLAAAGLSFLPLILLLAERMRNAGKFTTADVLAFRLNDRPARIAAALGTLSVAVVYLLAQMIGAGVLIEALIGVDFTVSVIGTGCLMILYVITGGMLATTWVQIVKAGLLMMTGIVLTILVLARFGFNPVELFDTAVAKYPQGEAYLSPGSPLNPNAISSISFGLALLLGTAGLPHILMRFFTVPDARTARSSVAWSVVLIGLFFIMTLIIGVGARAVLGQSAVKESAGGNLATTLLAQELGGGKGTAGGDLFLAIISAVAFATILAVVAGLVIASSGAMAHDLWSNVVRKGQASEQEEVRVGRIAAAGLGIVAITLAILAGKAFNVSLLIGLAVAIGASTNLPTLIFALWWRRFNTTGAITGIAGGLTVAVLLIVMSPDVWPGPPGDSPVQLSNPAIVSVPAGFLCCWLGTILSKEHGETRTYHELHVRAETGLGSEGSIELSEPEPELEPVGGGGR